MSTQTYALTRDALVRLIKAQPAKTCFYIALQCDLPNETDTSHLPVTKSVKVSKRAALEIAAEFISEEREKNGWRIPGWIYTGADYTGFYIGS